MLIPLGVFIGADAPKTLFGGRWNLGRKDADDEWTFVAFLAILKSHFAGRSVDRPCVFSEKSIRRAVIRVGCDAIATCLVFVACMVEWLILRDSLARTYYYSLDYGISSLAILVGVPVEKIRNWREDAKATLGAERSQADGIAAILASSLQGVRAQDGSVVERQARAGRDEFLAACE